MSEVKFSPTQKALFEKNISELINPYQAQALSLLEPREFQIYEGRGDILTLNFLHKSSGRFVYENPLLELEEKLQIFQNKFLLYPVLYFYGFGNGVLFKTLLKNSHLKHLIIFEDELEILYYAFHFLDFSEDLRAKRLLIFDSQITQSNLNILLNTPSIFSFSKLYFLHILSAYYERFDKTILSLNENIATTLKNNISALGNSTEDVLEGVTQFVANLVPMLTHTSFEDLLKTRTQKVKSALIVSTGPSLTKQLPLLKAHQDKFSIICADSAYSILAQHDIKPDYVLMCERTELTSELIKKAHVNIDEGVIFVLLSLVHPSAVRYLEETKRRFILVPYNDEFSSAFKIFNPTYTLAQGTTVAYNAFWIALYLKHENIIFIGQDLAYGEGGVSHPSEYIYGENYEAEYYPLKETTQAYGGDGEVQTHGAWNYFRYHLEVSFKNIHFTHKNVKIYNATEGGARIAHTEEKPFLWCIENLGQSHKKPFSPLALPSLEKQNKKLTQAGRNLAEILKSCEDFSDFFEKFSLSFENSIAKLKLLAPCSNKNFIRDLIADIDRAKARLDEFNRDALCVFYYPYLRQFELELAKLITFNPQNEEQWWEKNVLFITQHLEFFQILSATVVKFKNALEQNAQPLKNELKKRGLKNEF